MSNLSELRPNAYAAQGSAFRLLPLKLLKKAYSWLTAALDTDLSIGGNSRHPVKLDITNSTPMSPPIEDRDKDPSSIPSSPDAGSEGKKIANTEFLAGSPIGSYSYIPLDLEAAKAASSGETNETTTATTTDSGEKEHSEEIRWIGMDEMKDEIPYYLFRKVLHFSHLLLRDSSFMRPWWKLSLPEAMLNPLCMAPPLTPHPHAYSSSPCIIKASRLLKEEVSMSNREIEAKLELKERHIMRLGMRNEYILNSCLTPSC